MRHSTSKKDSIRIKMMELETENNNNKAKLDIINGRLS